MKRLAAAVLAVSLLMGQVVYAGELDEGTDTVLSETGTEYAGQMVTDTVLEAVNENEVQSEQEEKEEAEEEPEEKENTEENGSEERSEEGSDDGEDDPETNEPVVLTGWIVDEDGNSFYYDGDGNVTRGEKKINGQWYYFDEEDGVMQTGFRTIAVSTGGTKTVYYGTDGAMIHGLQTIGDATYYFHAKTGAMQFGEQKVNGRWYYFDTGNGKMQTGFRKIKLNAGGTKLVYYGPDGSMYYGIRSIGDKTYYFHTKTGAMQYGEQKISGRWYYFDPSTGVMQTGFQNIPIKTGGTKRVYYGYTGAMCYGEQKVNGQWYYLHPSTGAMQTGFQDVPVKTGGTKRVYYGADGVMCHGTQIIDGISFYFHTSTGELFPKMLWPVNSSRITSYFGERESPTAGASTAHKGVDIGNVPIGTPIYAAADGTVVLDTYDYYRGRYLIIDHGHGVLTYYQHCSELYVKEGDKVSRGDVIAAVGSTGISTGPHLHFGVCVNDVFVDPFYYVTPPEKE